MARCDLPDLVVSELANQADSLSSETMDYCLSALSLKHVNQDDPTGRTLLKSEVFSRAMSGFIGDSSGLAVGRQVDIVTTLRGLVGAFDGSLGLELSTQLPLRRFVYVPMLLHNCYSLLVLDRLLGEAYFVDCFLRFEIFSTIIRVVVDALADLCNCQAKICIFPCGLDCGVQSVTRDGVPGADRNNCADIADGGANFKSGIRTCVFAERLFSLEIEATRGGLPNGSTSSSSSSDAVTNARSLLSLMTQWTFTIPDFLMELENLMELIHGDEQEDYRTHSNERTCFSIGYYHNYDDSSCGGTKSGDLSRTKNDSRLTLTESGASQNVAGHLAVGRGVIVEENEVLDRKDGSESPSDHDSVSSGFETLNGEDVDVDDVDGETGDDLQFDNSAQGLNSSPRSINSFSFKSEWLEGFKGSFVNLKKHENQVCARSAEVPGASGAAINSKPGLPGTGGKVEGKTKLSPPKTSSRRGPRVESAMTPSFDLSTVSGTYFSNGLDIDLGDGLQEFLQLPEGSQQWATSSRAKPRRLRRTKVEMQSTSSARERQKSRGRQKYRQLKETNPEKYEETLATSRSYYRRLKSTDQVAYEGYKARYREHYQTLKQADPVAYEAYKARCRERYYKKRAAEGAEVVSKIKT